VIKRYCLCILFLLLGACKHEQKGTHIIVVNRTAFADHLYFEGIIKPINRISVTSPAEGAVDKRFFNYGQQINKDAPLFHITSSKLQEEYRNAFTNYLKALQGYQDIENWEKTPEVFRAKQALTRAKNALAFSKDKFKESSELMRLGYISRDEYNSDKRQMSDNDLSYQEAEQSLNEVVKKGQGINKEIAKISLEQTLQSVGELRDRLSRLTVVAPVPGIALFPSKESSAGSADQSGNILDVGSQVKYGDTLVTLGNLSGIEIDVHVNEVDISRIAVGQPVLINGTGFPGIILKGLVARVDAQAISSGNELPNFRIAIQVPTISNAERSKIHVGMSAKIEVQMPHPALIKIPIAAIVQKNGKAMVQVLDTKEHIKWIPVETGHTQLDTVEIIHGLKTGDRVMVND
jgi:HlyD family secretion protein